ncbi:thiamine phosphate synthase [Paraliomyxa miuraensis]|uniref:thiamine phosphate synthase n=1 Tax=Paraliomyxa miuraensis TaxID=376150 RepID=UPI00224E4D1F|nr:thiamine phosphate synthase [Paraliomyxa miuraensis]MCX4244324.1 thiamine phosphate synthase [Paraliomyxa miuraensis]
MQGLYAIVDVPHRHGLSVEDATRAVLGDRLEGGRDGASVVQLRAKHATTEQRVRWLEQLVPLCRAAGTTSIVDDDLEAAIEGRADGVHLGQRDEGADDVAGVRARAAERGHPTLKVGLSTHDLGQLRAAGRRGPDYLALGPVAPTRSKVDPEPVVGWQGLLDGCRVAARPLIAIGGLDLELGRRAIEAGAAAVAVIGELALPEAEAVRSRAITLARAFRDAAAPLPLDEVHRRIPVLSRELLAELASWGDALGVHIGLGLPARFSPRVESGRPLYRPCDVLDLVEALGKRPDQSWAAWSEATLDDAGPLVQLRLRTP